MDTAAQMRSMDRASLRQHWHNVAQLLRCPECRTQQIALRAFGSSEAHWQCRLCRHEWKTSAHAGGAQ